MTDDAPLLNAADVIAAWRANALPQQWRFIVADGSLRPLAAFGTQLALIRGVPAVGEVGCVVAGDQVRFRRVLARDRDACLLRAEVAPFADGWSTAVVGAVR